MPGRMTSVAMGGSAVSSLIPSVTTGVAALMRGVEIRPYRPRVRNRERAVMAESAWNPFCRCEIHRERGRGGSPTVVVPGFVPDATEVVEFQRDILRTEGPIYYLNYSRTGFSRRLFHAQLADLLEDIVRRGGRARLFGISFGAGLILDFIRQGLVPPDHVSGMILVSPVLTLDDLVRHEGGGGSLRLLECGIRRILRADRGGGDLELQIQRTRRSLRALFEAGASTRQITSRHIVIRPRIMDALENTTTRGAYERFNALREFRFPGSAAPLFGGPLLAILSDGEEDLLVPGSPSLTHFADRSEFSRLFPAGECIVLASDKPGETIPHASLIFHHEQYNPRIAEWIARSRRRSHPVPAGSPNGTGSLVPHGHTPRQDGGITASLLPLPGQGASTAA